MIEMFTKNQKLNLFSKITKHTRFYCGFIVLLLMSGSAWAQTAGESCDNPIVVSLPFTASGNTVDYGNDYGSSDVPSIAPGAVTNGTGSGSYLGGDDVVFAYTPSSNHMINVSSTTTETDVGLWAFTGCAFTSTVGYHTNLGGNTRAINDLPVLAGTTYYFVISTWPSPDNTDFTINIEESVADCADLGLNIGSPCDDGDENTINDVVNDDCECAGIIPPDGMVCEAPIEITTLPYTTTDNTENYGDNYGSTDRPALADGAIGSPGAAYLNGDDVVYSYTPGNDGFIDISVTEHGTWAGVFVFTGCPFASTVGGHTNSSATTDLVVGQLPVEAGVTYYIVISTNAAPQSTPYTLSITETVFDCPALEADIGTACDDGDENTINDVINEDCECAGIIPPDGMVCEAPIEITNLPYTTTDNTENYDDNYGSADRPALAEGAIGNPSGTYLTGDDAVYSYTPGNDGFIDVSVTGHGTWAGVFVFTGCPFASTVGGHTNSSATVDLEVIGLPVEAGETYYIVISTNAAPQTTPYTLSVTETVFDCPDLDANIGAACDDGDPLTVNDSINENCECEGEPTIPGEFCGNPFEITELPYTTTDNTESYGDNYGSADRPALADGAIGNPSGSYLTGDDVVYVYTPAEDELINISVTEHGSWTGLFVFTGCPFASTVGGHTNSSATIDLMVEQLPVQAGVAYYIVISTNASPQTTPYTLTITKFEDCDVVTAGIPDEDNLLVCVGDAFTIGVTGATEPAAGLESIWQSSPAGENIWTDIDGASSASLTISAGISEATDYRYAVTCVSSDVSDESDVIQVSITTNATECYCIPQGTNPGRYISGFSTTGGIENISNIGSGFSTDGYGDFTSLSVEQTQTQSISFEVSIVGGTSGFRIWVDWNQDGQFDTTDEVAYQSSTYKALHTGSIMIPEEALPGSTRMRIVSNWSNIAGAVDPCATGFSSGEFEDYTFIVFGDEPWECPDLEANIGDTCDDGDDTTENDIITDDCECVGTPIAGNDQCGFENFDNSNVPAGTSYVDGSFVGNDGVTWTYVAARDENADANGSGIDGNAIMLRRIADDSKITSSPVAGGISDFSVKLYKGFTGGGDRQVELFVNGESQGLSDAFDDYDEHVFTVPGINISGDVVIEIRNNTSRQIIIDDITWTCGPDAVFDCPDLEANIGDACDDGDATTENDTIDENCVCHGVATTPPGEVCANPLQITELPYTTTDNTENYGDNYESSDRPPLAPGAIGSPSASYLSGDDVVYEYTPTEDTYIDISVTEHGTWAGVFVFTGCPFESTVGGHTSSSGSVPLEVNILPVSAGVTYYIVISTWATPQSTPYTLNVSETVFDCPDLEANIGGACDDGDSTTYGDVADENCNCAGTPYECLPLEANIGDACDDGDPLTANDTVDENCECVGEATVPGEFCGNPIEVTELPYTTTDNTENYGDNYGPSDMPPLAEGAIGSPSSSYLNGDDAVYAFTPFEDMTIDISVTNHGTWAGVFVFTECPFESTVGGHTNSSGTVELMVEHLPVQGGVTYYIVISTFATPQSTPYTLNITRFTDCEGTPSAGVPDENAIVICAGAPLTLSVTGATEPAGGLERIWQSSPAGDNVWTNIAGATSETLTLSAGIMEATDFRYAVTCVPSGESDESDVIEVTLNPNVTECYCTPIYSTGCSGGDRITNVMLEGESVTLNNSTECSPDGYGDYRSLPAPDLVSGENYSISVSTDYSSPTSEQVKVWIDYNQNGLFDADEVIANTNGAGLPGGTGTMTFTLLDGLDDGTYTMRVRMGYGSSAPTFDACNSVTWGEAEDYLIEVITLDECVGTPSAGIPTEDALLVCPNVAFTVGVSGSTEPADGLVRVWQSSPAGENVWTDIAGSTSVSLTVSEGVSVDTDFRYVISCTPSGEADESDVIEVTVNTNITECYCIPTTNGSLAYINGFSATGDSGQDIENLNTGASLDGTGYSDFTGLPALNGSPGSEVEFTVNIGPSGTTGLRIWVDWNQNGVFDDQSSGEVAYSSTGYLGIHNGSFTIPGDALGTYRIRVGASYSLSGGPADPCALTSSGEYEDYIIEVAPLDGCTEAIAGTPDEVALEACAGDAFTLSVTGATQPGDGLVRTWQSSPAGEDVWTDIAESSSTSYTVSGGITEATDYRYSVTCTSGDGSEESDVSDVIQVTLAPGSECYCTFTPPSYVEPITYVGFGDIDNTTSASSVEGYEDFTGLSTSLNPGDSYTISLEGFTGGNYTNYFTVFIDWNQNGLLNDEGEMYEIGSIMNSTGTDGVSISNSIEVPVDAVVGNTRMRIIKNYNSSPTNPCGSVTFGQIEDYTVEVAVLDGCTEAVAGTPDEVALEVCAANGFTLSVTGASAPGDGLERMWQSSPAGEDVWTNIDGAGSPSYTVLGGILEATDYRYVVTCTPIGVSDVSDIIQVTLAPAIDCYCTPELDCTDGDMITNVSFLEINNTTACSPNGYGDFTDMIANVETGGTYPISVTVGDGWLNESVSVWIDFNNNGSFDQDEFFYIGTGSDEALTGDISIPAEVTNGDYRMRVRVAAVGADAATWDMSCVVGEGFGESEDYTVTVIQGVTWDCPEIEANVGDACDMGDGSPGEVGANCECQELVPDIGTDCSVAIDLECNADAVTHSSDGSMAVNTTDCEMGSAGLWFTFTGTGYDITFKSTATFDHKISMNSGSCDILTNIGCAEMPSGIGEKIYTVENSVEGEIYYVYVAHWSSLGSETGNITVSIECEEAPVFDCPEFEANIGDACDDGNDMTENDMYNDDCECVGTPVLADGQCGFENFNNTDFEEGSFSYVDGSFDGNNGVTWTYVAARDENGDANESGIDGNAIMLRRITSDSKITSSPVAGGISDFSVKLYKGFTGAGDRQAELFVNGVSQGLSEAFDDFEEHIFTVPGINITGDVVIEIRNATDKQLIIDDISWTCGPDVVWECPEFEANIGDACDDGDDTTEDDMYNDDCECVGTPIVEWECPEFEANIGDVCDDGDDTTEDDMYNDDCECVGTPIVEWECPEIEANIGDPCVSDSEEDGIINEDCDCIVVGISDISTFSFTMYPNPAGSNESVTLTSNQSIDRYEILDITGKLVDAKVILNQNEITIALRNYSAGLYILKAYSGSDYSTQKMVVR